jgi:general secretion pathway protein F
MIFEYTAIDPKGKEETDIIDAPNPAKAREKLRAKGLYTTSIKPKSTDPADDPQDQSVLERFSRSFSDFFSKRSSAKQVGLFSRQLATLLTAGMPLLRAIGDILDQTEHAHFKNIIAEVKQKLEEGQSFSTSLSRHKGVFSEMYVNMVRVGENLGSLETVIERLADLEEKRLMLRRKLQTVMLYPSFLVFFASLVIIFLMVFIIPMIGERFADMGHELPLPTRIVMGISSFLSSYWILISIAILAGVFFTRRYLATQDGKEKLHGWLLTMPIVSRLYRKQLILKFTQNLGILLNNNVDIIKSFEIVKKVVGNIIIERKIDEASQKIKEGTPVSKALSKADFLPKLVIGMISAGEASDKLDEMLIRIGTVYENELDQLIASITSIIDPVIIVVMGGAIGIIVISVMLPIMEMNLLVQ